MICIFRTVVQKCLSWYRNPRIIASVLLGLAMSIKKVSGYCSFAEALGMPVNILEPFVILGSTPISFVSIFLGGLLLISDAPFITPLGPQEMLRIGRKKWVWSQIAYLVVTSLFYYICIMLFSMLLTVLRYPSLVSVCWSDAMLHLAIRQPEFAIRSFGLSFPYPDYINSTTPLGASFLTLIYNSAYMILIGLCTLTINLLTKRNIGWIVAAGIHIGSYIIYANLSWLYPAKFSLLCCAIPAYHYDPMLDMPSLYCVLLFSVCIAFITCICRYFANSIEPFESTI